MFGILTILIIILTVIIATERPTKQVKKTPNTLLTKPSPTNSTNPSVPAPTNTPTPSPQPTVIPPTATPTNKPTQQSQKISDFQYPGSTIISIINNAAVFESNDDPKKITDWYKDKIKSLGMTATSFVQTNSNGNILNKLVGAKSGSEVRVEITKQNNSQKLKISVSLSIDN